MVYSIDKKRYLDGKVLIEKWKNWKGAIDCFYTGRIWQSDELFDLSDRIYKELESKGFIEGDIIAVLLSNTAYFPAVLMALLSIGCNPLLMHVSITESELNDIVDRFSVKWVIHDFIEGLSRLFKSCYEDNAEVAVGSDKICIFTCPTGVSGSHNRLNMNGVILHSTSGTYGASKYCVRNQRVAIAEGINYTTSIDIYRKCKVTVTTPLSHAFAYGFGLISSILTDSTLELDITFNPKRLLRKQKDEVSDILAIVPPMIKPLVYLGCSDASHQIHKVVFYAGAPCNEALSREFEETFKTTLFAIYGSTETGAITTNYYRNIRLQGVGKPLRNVSVRTLEKDTYKDLGEEVGEIYVKSSSMMQGYMDGSRLEEEIDSFPTGDIGFQDEKGNVHLIGRVKDIINLGGMKVDPSEVEKVLLENPQILDAAVYPGYLENGNEIVQAAICIKGSEIDLNKVKQYCYKCLSSYMVPSKYYIVKEIPRSPSGKCLKNQLPHCPDIVIS